MLKPRMKSRLDIQIMRLIVGRDLSQTHEEVDKDQRTVGLEFASVEQSDDLL